MKIGIVYAFIYLKVKDSSKITIININPLKEIISRTIIRSGGIPRFMVREIIEEMIGLGLLERMNKYDYKILENDCYKKVKQKLAYFC